jgi:protein-S-isoprenylcysteine O-methyltransferase Ste14
MVRKRGTPCFAFLIFMEEKGMLNRTNGVIGAVVGVILALAGVVSLFALNHHTIGRGLLILGVIVLAVGIFAFIAGGRVKGRAA